MTQLNNKELAAKILAEQDPSTLMRLVHNTPREQLSDVVRDVNTGSQVLHKIYKMIIDNKDLAKQISGEAKTYPKDEEKS